MVEIRIDIKKVRNANYNFPSIISGLSAQKRNLGLLKWRIPSEIQNKKAISDRLNAIFEEMDKAERQMNDIYKVTTSAVTQYTDMENTLNQNASKFK